jgi:hypothetical protein
VFTPAVVLSRQFWINLGVAVLASFSTAFLGSLAATAGVPTLHSLETAAWAGAAGALAIILHSFGATAAIKAAASK